MRLSLRPFAAFAAAVLLAALSTGSARATAAPPGDQPLPGYTIVNPPLTPASVGGSPSRVIQGVRDHAGFIIEVPPGWNGELVLYAHGYAGTGTVLAVGPPPFGLRQRLLDQGYAWAASSYYRNGYDVRAGVLTTRRLAEHFADVVGEPGRRYLAGVSMGGHIIGRSLEQYPGYYDGALPMCGALGDNRLFDYFLDYNLVAQALAGVDEYPVGPDYAAVTVPKIQQELGLAGLVPGGPDTLNALGRQFRDIVVNRTGGPRPGAAASFAFWKDFPFGLAASATPGAPDLADDPGRVATNLGTRYTPDSPFDVNAEVRRVPPADLAARLSERLSQVPRIDGRPGVPVLSVHNIGDLFVPLSMEQIYAGDVARHHQSENLVQRAIRSTGHCEFTPAEAGAAWDDLVAWVEDGTRPAGDAVADPAAVADPGFGCRFSDAAAWTAGVGSRRLFGACA
ncbi:hypothetical protein AB0M28_16535 [Streptomyces sp. NPDC051940]|uniref:hypothetical protein n=1 Tax=Streptomyces sp. NPDC051940 TaxID=3155675 RepID=UPI003430C2CD